MKERIKLIIYIATVIIITSIHELVGYLAIFIIIALISVKNFTTLIRKAIKSVLIFNMIISLSYAVYSAVVSEVDWRYLLMINLRVLLLTYVTFYLVKVCNVFSALSFSKNLSYLIMLAYSQIINFRKVYEEMKLAFRSRLLYYNKEYLRYLSMAAVNLFLIKSMYNAKALSEGMNSRGFFNDKA